MDIRATSPAIMKLYHIEGIQGCQWEVMKNAELHFVASLCNVGVAHAYNDPNEAQGQEYMYDLIMGATAPHPHPFGGSLKRSNTHGLFPTPIMEIGSGAYAYMVGPIRGYILRFRLISKVGVKSSDFRGSVEDLSTATRLHGYNRLDTASPSPDHPWKSHFSHPDWNGQQCGIIIWPLMLIYQILKYNSLNSLEFRKINSLSSTKVLEYLLPVLFYYTGGGGFRPHYS